MGVLHALRYCLPCVIKHNYITLINHSKTVILPDAICESYKTQKIGLRVVSDKDSMEKLTALPQKPVRLKNGLSPFPSYRK